MTRTSFFLIGFLVFTIGISTLKAQVEMPTIPAMRQLHHDYIIRSLEQIESLNLSSAKLNPKDIAQVKLHVEAMRASIELNYQLDNNGKFKWLRGVNELLSGFISAYQSRVIAADQYPLLVKSFDAAMQTDWIGLSIEPIIKVNTINIGSILVENFAFKENIGIGASKDLIILKQCQKTPDRILSILSINPTNRYADSLITIAGFRNPEELYNYAAAPNALGKKIQSVNHPFVKLVARLSLTKTGRMYFPFLDNIYNGVTPIDSITPFVLNDTSKGYYKLLVKTRIQYAERMQRGDTPMAANILTAKLKSKAVEVFINEINALHNEKSDLIRFKKLEGLSPVELYYLAVIAEDEMYTSSFVSGVYPRIFARMNIPRSDALLQLVKHDYYKKFLKIAASYNMLDDFLSRMDTWDAEKLIKGFVNGLEKTNTLEDAVDVADSYASIYTISLKKLILSQVQNELLRCKDLNNKRGVVIYDLLHTIFLSMDSTNKINLSARLGIMPIYELPNKLLRDTINGKIAIQQFFYGDKDGSVVFNSFLNKFRNPNWQIIKKSQWVEVHSVRGVPVTIYANLPLDEKLELDEKAQDSLIDYLFNNAIQPSVAIHRGHSYYLKNTIDKLPAGSKLVLVGSCGGYQKLNDILEICPGAHIISSKQIGTGIINQGMIDVICEQLRLGKDLNWPLLWNSLAIRFNGSAREKFNDYVPPHKNLGAIFITAYNNAYP
jgi:hypothetical protein